MLGNIKCSCIFPHKIIWLKCSSELWWNKQAQFSCCWIQILLCFSPLPCTHGFFRPHWPCSTLPFHWMWISSRNQMPLAWLKTKCPQILETSFHLVNICRLEHILRNHSAFDQFHVFRQLFTSGWAGDPFTLAFPAVSPFSVPPPFTICFSRFVCFTFELLIWFNIAAQEQGSVCSILFIQVFN